MHMEKTSAVSKPVALKSDLNIRFPATLQFFVVLEKGKDSRVLPAVLNLKRMSNEDMANLPMRTVLSGKVIIPQTPEPWSGISKEADHFFLMLQSRNDWGQEIKPGGNLFEVEKVKKLIELLEESLNSFTWRKDLSLGKFDSREKYPEEVIKENKQFSSQENPAGGMEPGQNWKI